MSLSAFNAVSPPPCDFLLGLLGKNKIACILSMLSFHAIPPFTNFSDIRLRFYAKLSERSTPMSSSSAKLWKWTGRCWSL